MDVAFSNGRYVTNCASVAVAVPPFQKAHATQVRDFPDSVSRSGSVYSVSRMPQGIPRSHKAVAK